MPTLVCSLQYVNWRAILSIDRFVDVSAPVYGFKIIFDSFFLTSVAIFLPIDLLKSYLPLFAPTRPVFFLWFTGVFIKENTLPPPAGRVNICQCHLGGNSIKRGKIPVMKRKM
jgi:hypothetical protein